MGDISRAKLDKHTGIYGYITYQLNDEQEHTLAKWPTFHIIPSGAGLLSATNAETGTDRITIHLTFPKHLKPGNEYTLDFDDFSQVPYRWAFHTNEKAYEAGSGKMTIRIKNDGKIVEGNYSFITQTKIYSLKGTFWFEITFQ